jgi:hypothetical protein
LLIDSDEEATTDFIKIDYLTERTKTHHANKKLQDDFKEIKDGISCTQSAAPSKLESTSIAADANDEARSHISPSTLNCTRQVYVYPRRLARKRNGKPQYSPSPQQRTSTSEGIVDQRHH